jgi:hypothetical protein
MSIDYKKMIANLTVMTLVMTTLSDAWAIQSTVKAPSKSNTGGDLALFYARSTADSKNAYFNESYGAALALDWAPTKYTAFRVGGSLTREIGVLEEKFRTSNTDVTLSFLSYKPVDELSVNTSVTATLPTNEDDRRYLTYRGSVGGSLSLVKTFSTSSIFNRLLLVGSLNVTRSFFEFDANREGGLNRFWGATAGLSAGYSILEYLSIGAGVANTRGWNSDGGRGLDRYRLNYNLTYKSEPDFSFRLEYVTSDRTFNYDYNSNNIALYDAEISSVVGTLKYEI